MPRVPTQLCARFDTGREYLSLVYRYSSVLITTGCYPMLVHVVDGTL